MSTVFPPTTVKPCSLHLEHRPKVLTVELHHVVPQAWQRFWAPPGARWDLIGPWFPETVAICPSGHRSVHFLIDLLMHATKGENVEEAYQLVGKHFSHYSEWALAKRALATWESVGGSFEELVTHGLYGQA